MRDLVTMGATVIVKGSFEPIIKGLTGKTARGIIRASLRRAAQQTILKEAKKNAKKSGRQYAKDLIVKTTVTNTVANARIGAKKGSNWAKIGHLVENGTAPHTMFAGAFRRTLRGSSRVTRKSRPSNKRVMKGSDGTIYGRAVDHPGSRPKPWLMPAWRAKRKEAVAKFGVFIVEEFDKAIAKGKR